MINFLYLVDIYENYMEMFDSVISFENMARRYNIRQIFNI